MSIGNKLCISVSEVEEGIEGKARTFVSEVGNELIPNKLHIFPVDPAASNSLKEVAFISEQCEREK